MKKWKQTAGFTLVELIVVIAILGILAGVGTVGYSGYIKKANMAADEQLLGFANQAFTTACLENGVDARSLTSASMPLTADKKVDVDNVSPYAAAFAKYFAGNENSVFKVAEYLRFANGMFMIGEGENIYDVLLGILSGQADDIAAVKESAFYNAEGLGVNGLMNKVGFLTGMVGGVTVWPDDENPDGNGAYQLLFSYVPDLMGKLGITDTSDEAQMAVYNDMVSEKIALMAAADPDGFGKADSGTQEQLAMNELMANFAVIQAAERMTDTTVADTLALLKDPDTNFVDILKTDSTNGVTQASLAYGLYTAYAYANQDADAIKNTEDPLSLLKNINDPDFIAYLDTPEAQKDVEGYVSAMNMINSSSDDVDALSSLMVNGFTDPALGSVLQQVMSK